MEVAPCDFFYTTQETYLSVYCALIGGPPFLSNLIHVVWVFIFGSKKCNLSQFYAHWSGFY